MFGESQRGHLRFSEFAFALAGAILELEVVQEIGEEEGVILEILSSPISVVFPANSS